MPNQLVNEAARQRQFQLHLPEGLHGCAIGEARAEPPHVIAEARGPTIIKGRYFYDREVAYLHNFVNMALMGILTQCERLASGVVHVIQSVTGFFGFSLPQLNRVALLSERRDRRRHLRQGQDAPFIH